MSRVEIDILETCKRNLSVASPDTLRAVIRMFEESEVGKSEKGIEFSYIAAQLLTHVYPVAAGELQIETPSGSIFPELFKQIENGEIPELKQADISFFTVLVMPVAVLYTENKSIETASLDYINQAIQMNDKSVLPIFLRGFIAERNAQYDAALADYSRTLEMDPSCYPAEIGTARIYSNTGKHSAAVEIMNLLAAQYPYSIDILTKATETLFKAKDYDGALDMSSNVLRMEPDNPDILIMRAKIFMEQGNFTQAERLIDVLERANWESPSFYLIKSDIERENGDNASALKTLEKGHQKYPSNKQIEQAYGAVLMLTGRKDEGREILTGEDSVQTSDSENLIVLIDDAVETKDWEAASEYADKLSSEDMSLKAGLKTWSVWRSQGENEKALDIAADLYKKYPGDTSAAIAFIKSLLDMERRLQVRRVIDEQLAIEDDAEYRSELYYLQSLTADSDESQLQALRSALFEDLKNIEALVSISDLYVEMGDVRKAYRYIKQAAILSPNDKGIQNKLAKIEKELR
ncbi:MAG: tetratricopeptide repeat protein [Spirochaetales bacterium]|nr:tetratricopeptide repeat protein [Spirochaetales bacterium]